MWLEIHIRFFQTVLHLSQIEIYDVNSMQATEVIWIFWEYGDVNWKLYRGNKKKDICRREMFWLS